MKGKVLQNFIDKDTLVPYHAGGVYESDDENRMTFLQESGYVEIVGKTRRQKKPPAGKGKAESGEQA